MPAEDFEHPIAIYYDGNDVRTDVLADRLADDKIFEMCKGLELFDPTGQIRLFAREIKGRERHFHAPASKREGLRETYARERNDAHDKRVEYLLGKLKLNQRWKIVIPTYQNGERGISELFDLRGYKWGSEIHRIVGSDAVVRHDLFGQGKQIEMSILRPFVAIEVINTHYLEEGAFSALISFSKIVPLLIAFDFVARRNYFLGISKN